MKAMTLLLVSAFTVLLSIPPVQAKEIAGINIPEILDISQTKLVLNGAGIRTKFFLKLYISGLYLQQAENKPDKIIEADEPMAIRLHITSSIVNSDKMENATREGFQNSTGNNIDPIKPQIEKIIAVFKDEIQENDVYDLLYKPAKGVEVFKNGNPHSLITGFDFKKALFGIWLCDNPAQESLKKEMLGL